MMHASSDPLPVLPRVGETLDERFELRAALGEGGMGHVFRAYDHHAAREVALKLLAPRYLGRPERERRFLREAELGHRAHHRNLVEYLDAGRLPSSRWPFLTMALVEGGHLGHRLARGALPVRVATRVARQLAGAVQALHRAGVVHRDVTPMNVLIRDEDAVLIDLSHAGDANAPRLAVGSADRLTQPHEVPGTHFYMPREQAQAAPAHPAMDAYAFGVTLVEMLTGRAPSGLDRATFIAMQREGKFVPPRVDVRVHAEVPAELAALADACTSAAPEDRPTFDEIIERLDRVLARWVVRVADVGPRSLLLAANEARWEGAADVERDLSAPQPRTSNRRQVVLVAVGAALLAVGAWGAWTGLAGPERGPGDGGRMLEPSADHEAAVPTRISEPPPGIVGRDTEDDDDPPPAIADVGQRGVPPPVIPTERPAQGDAPGPTRAPAKVRPADTEECARVREQAAAAVDGYEWSRVVTLARRTQCWRSDAPRRRMLVQGLFHENKWAECVRAGGNSKDPEVKRWVEFCKHHTG